MMFSAKSVTVSMLKMSLAVSLGAIALLASSSVAAQSRLNPNTSSNLDQSSQISLAQAANSPLSDGIYLYGESSQPEQMGREYLVFQVQQGRMVGAFYLPQSEFSCFSGTIDSRKLNLSIVDPYDQTTYAYAIPLQTSSSVAASVPSGSEVGLEGYHRLAQLSTNDRRILNICLEQSR